MLLSSDDLHQPRSLTLSGAFNLGNPLSHSPDLLPNSLGNSETWYFSCTKVIKANKNKTNSEGSAFWQTCRVTAYLREYSTSGLEVLTRLKHIQVQIQGLSKSRIKRSSNEEKNGEALMCHLCHEQQKRQRQTCDTDKHSWILFSF